MSRDAKPIPTVDFSALQRKRRLPPPPSDASENLAVPEIAAAAPSGGAAGAPPPDPEVRRGKVIRPYVPVEPPPEAVDGRSRLRTGRVEPFSTRVRADFRPRLIALADRYGVTMGEALELAVEALEREIRVAQIGRPRPGGHCGLLKEGAIVRRRLSSARPARETDATPARHHRHRLGLLDRPPRLDRGLA